MVYGTDMKRSVDRKHAQNSEARRLLYAPGRDPILPVLKSPHEYSVGTKPVPTEYS